MRTNIEIDEKLMEEAMKASGLTTKKATVEEGLRLILTLKKQKQIKEFRGKMKWEGDLDKMRTDS
ncbi:VapB protein of antitoxin of type II toxin-antitoxin system [Algoriphagus ratkowskyi]|uniref:Type II toxin-antitoxin system VapB family antitoxin n=1 Tax=Algoriphagus ratkowskyi TaxID=57028 RepID=A0A2W7RHY2_9BACT|nr:type II toxin-antitoxin system VapB family antitoxin [Algoriphagus ratkowskyi]PZX59841.1 VapB protein of antitoxin of type II toxin-antitoxin system [Algoriphagus ratkowskyi]TXD78451.1 type II toxin-antitoxin system VapB family antitoxin [Algoriphagus ratkowskyi]